MKKVFRLQYASDIHLEKRVDIPTIVPAYENLALVGDIGNPFTEKYTTFVESCSKLFDNVFVVPGNHEYYSDSFEIVSWKLDGLKAYFRSLGNVELLNNNVVQIDNLRIAGSVLWCSNERYIHRHQQCLAFIHKQLQSVTPLIMLTHYPPSYKLMVNKYRKFTNSHDLYYNHLDHLVRDPVIAWISGHTHCQTVMKINGVFCGINACGHSVGVIPQTGVDLHY